jgi:hypothetical protein
MRAEKKTNDNGKLPPGIPIPVLPVDFLKAHPENWIGGEGSYVCPVDSEWGIWFNWTMNNPNNTAVLSSVKGMNPLTGQRIEGYGIEEYQDECPIHHKPFSKGRLCTECGFKWPAQNYLSQPNKLYLDGFLTPEGVRQFYFTEDMAKSVPELCIGKEDTVPAFGFCFYKQKEYTQIWEGGKHHKNEFPINFDFRQSISGITGIGGVYGYHGPSGVPGYRGVRGIHRCKSLESSVLGSASSMPSEPAITYTSSSGGPICAGGASIGESLNMATMDSFSTSESNIEGIASASCFYSSAELSNAMVLPLRERRDFRGEVGIGAGAQIKQQVEKSKFTVESWENKPTGIIRLYFIFQEEFEKYASAGFNNLKGNKLGYLEGIPVGGNHD